MTDFDPNIKQISGPTNVVRLEGRIHGIKKVIYLFMDWHIPVYDQTECTNLFSKDVHKYFIDTFYELNKKSSDVFDFFLEIRPTEELINKERLANMEKYKMMYIRQVMKFFAKIFKYDIGKKEVSTPDLFKNIRFHYLDIRDYFNAHIWYKLIDAQNIAYTFLANHITRNNFLTIIDLIKTSQQSLQTVISILQEKKYEEPKEKPVIIKEKKMEQEDIDVIRRLQNKMRYRYNDEDIKKILNKYMDDIVEKFKILDKNMTSAIQEFTDYDNYIGGVFGRLVKDINLPYLYTYGMSNFVYRKLTNRITDVCAMLHNDFVYIFVKITDIYFLRRFLDKDYVKNAIVYSGGAHSQNYVYILVNEFGFEITHISSSKFNNINELMKEIKTIHEKNINPEELTAILNPPVLYQCSDITSFPDNFQ